jgi:hypothetical protein
MRSSLTTVPILGGNVFDLYLALLARKQMAVRCQVSLQIFNRKIPWKRTKRFCFGFSVYAVHLCAPGFA